MVVRERARNVLANQGHYFNASYPQKRYTPSGPDHAQIAACHGISQYFDTLIEHHFGDSNDPQQRQRDLQTLIHKHEACLMAPLLSFLCERQDRGHLRLLGPRTASKRTPTIAFQLLLGAPRANHVAELAQGLAERGVGVGFGSFYSDRLLEALNIALNPGVVRISLVHYNTLDEVEWILSHLEDLL
jgi:selenocysteine lyase/cysteine desulfurase